MSKTLVEESKSPSGTWKAEIWRRDDGTLQVRLLHWTDEIVPDHGHVASFWEEIRTSTSITDSIEIARAIANELLDCHGDSDG